MDGGAGSVKKGHVVVGAEEGFVRASDGLEKEIGVFQYIIMTGQKFELFESRNTKSALRNEYVNTSLSLPRPTLKTPRSKPDSFPLRQAELRLFSWPEPDPLHLSPPDRTGLCSSPTTPSPFPAAPSRPLRRPRMATCPALGGATLPLPRPWLIAPIS